MTDQQPETTAPEGEQPPAGATAPEAEQVKDDAPAGEPAGEPASSTGGARTNEWIAQLDAMIREVATAAAPVARQVGAKAAELVAIAATKAGPIAQKAANSTVDYGQRVAERANAVAAELRSQDVPGGAGPAAEEAGPGAESPAEPAAESPAPPAGEDQPA